MAVVARMLPSHHRRPVLSWWGVPHMVLSRRCCASLQAPSDKGKRFVSVLPQGFSRLCLDQNTPGAASSNGSLSVTTSVSSATPWFTTYTEVIDGKALCIGWIRRGEYKIFRSALSLPSSVSHVSRSIYGVVPFSQLRTCLPRKGKAEGVMSKIQRPTESLPHTERGKACDGNTYQSHEGCGSCIFSSPPLGAQKF